MCTRIWQALTAGGVRQEEGGPVTHICFNAGDTEMLWAAVRGKDGTVQLLSAGDER